MAILHRRRLLFLAAAFALPVSALAAGVQYSVTVLGLVQHNYPNNYFNPEAINDNEVIAGNAIVRVPHNTAQSQRGVLWQATNHYQVLGNDFGGWGI